MQIREVAKDHNSSTHSEEECHSRPKPSMCAITAVAATDSYAVGTAEATRGGIGYIGQHVVCPPENARINFVKHVACPAEIREYHALNFRCA